MQTMQPALKRGRDVWDPINMPVSEFQIRIKNIRKAMRENQLDLVLLYGHGSEQYGHPCYVSNIIAKMPQGVMAVIPKQGEIVLVVEGFARDLPALKRTTWVDHVISSRDVAAETVSYLKKEKALPATVGMAGVNEYMPYTQSRYLMEALGISQIVDVSGMMGALRMAKSERELDQMRRSGRIVISVFKSVTDAPLKDLNEIQVEALIDYLSRLEGAEDIRLLFGRSFENGWSLSPAENRPLGDGEAITVYLAVSRERYWSEGIRTFRLNSLKLIVQEDEVAVGLYDRLIAGIKPGGSISGFSKNLLDELEENSLDAVFDYGLGNGIGLGLEEYPTIIPASNAQFLNGMCLAFRLAVKNKQLGHFMIGDTFVVGKAKVELLTQ